MRIAILDDYQNAALDCADWSGLDVTVFSDPLQDVAASLADFPIICIMRERTPFSREVFEALPNLKLLVTTGARNAAIDLEAAKDHGVLVAGTRSPGHATAELTWGLVLSLARNIPMENRNMVEGRWQTGIGTDLRGKTLGILGLGRLGAQVAGFGKAFGMNVVAWSRHLTDEKAAEFGVRRLDKEGFFKESDFLSIHMKYSQAIYQLVDDHHLSLMKPTAYLINTSRAPIIDTHALIQRLNTGQLAGAALDVYEQEPVPADDPIRHVKNLLLTPHIGYVTKETYQVFYGESMQVVRAYLSGEPFDTL